MGEGTYSAYYWRELTTEEYERFEKETMLFYRILDVILFFFIFGAIIFACTALAGIIKTRSIKDIITFAFAAIALIALWCGRTFVRNLGIKDLKEHNLLACEAQFLRCEEKTRSRNGNTRYDYYAVVSMPDGAELEIECALSDIDKCRTGDRIKVIRPRDSQRVQRMNVMV